ILVIDAGTSALRAVLVDRNGVTSPLAAEPYTVVIPEDAAPFGRECEPKCLIAALERLYSAASPHRDRVAAMAVTGQREGVAFTDEGGEAILVSPNVDARASAEGM